MQIDSLSYRSLLLLILLAIVATAYYPALSGPFVLDDIQNIPQTYINELNIASLIDIALSNTSGSFGRPIPVATFALNYYFGDGTPFAFKLTNLIIHLVNTWLVFLFVRHIISLETFNTRPYKKSHAYLLVLIATAVWALHPLQVSTVMYSVQRMTLLMTTFSLLALISYCVARRHCANRPGKSFLYLLLTATFTALACLSKENGVLVILYIGFLELLLKILSDKYAQPLKLRRLADGALIVTSASILLGSIYLFLKADGFRVSYSFREFTLSERLATEGIVLVLYLKNILIPNISNMNLYLDSFPVTTIHQADSIKSFTLLFLTCSAALLLLKKHPIVTFGIGFFFISHILESTIIPLEIAFEHRNYIGLLGISLTTVYVASLLVERLRMAAFVLPLLTLLFISTQTFSRNVEWSDSLLLHTLALEKNPQSYRARLALAVDHIDRANLTEAVQLFESATTDNQYDTKSRLRLIQFKAYGSVFSHTDYEVAQSLLDTQPITMEVSMILSNMLSQASQGLYDQPSVERISEMFKVASQNPNYKFRPNHKAALHARYSSLLSLEGKHIEALTELQTAISYNSRNPEIILMTAESMQLLDREGEISEVLDLLPDDISLTENQRTRLNELKKIIKNSVSKSISLSHSPE